MTTDTPATGDMHPKPSEWGEGREREYHWRDWEKRFADQVLSVAREMRKEKGLSAKQLSERLTAAGWPVSVNSVNGIFGKKGRESLSVTQLIALAEALDVSPGTLLFDYRSDSIEVRPGVAMSPMRAARWFLRGARIEKGPEPDELIDSVDQAVAYLSGFLKVVEQSREMFRVKDDGSTSYTAQ